MKPKGRPARIGQILYKDRLLKTASWFLTLLLAAALVYAFAQVPVIGPDSALLTHVESRYQQRALIETNIGNLHSKTPAVLSDYRSLDLWTLSILFSTAFLGIFLFYSKPPRLMGVLLPTAFLLLGILLTLGIGLLPLRDGNNFLDYEFLAAWDVSAQARPDGGFILLISASLTFIGLLLLCFRWFRASEASSDR